MKETELRQHAVCSMCKNKIGASGLPMFWTLKIERHGVKLDALQRQTGLTALLGGNAKLAQVMGADEEMTVPMMEPVNLTVCEDCCTEQVCVAELGGLE